MIRPVVLALALLLPSSAWASVSIIQQDHAHDQNMDVMPTFGASVAAGHTFVFALVRTSGSGTFTLDVDGSSSYAPTVTSGDGAVRIWVKRNVTGGFTMVTLNGSDDAGTTRYGFEMYDLSGVDNVASVTSGTNTTSAASSHTQSSAGLTGTGFFVGGSLLNTLQTPTPGSGWTRSAVEVPSGELVQYKIENGSSETGPFTTSGNTDTHSALVFVPETASGATPKHRMMGF